MSTESPPTSLPITTLDPTLSKELEQMLRGLAFGQVVLVVHDGTVVQIDRLERRRLKPSRESTGT